MGKIEKICPYCGSKIANDSRFCTDCGKPIPQGNVCPHCGASINDGDIFCKNCGVVLAKGKACPHCHAALNEGDLFCQNCGAKMEIAKEAFQNHNGESSTTPQKVQTEEKRKTSMVVTATQLKPIKPLTSENAAVKFEQPHKYSERKVKNNKGKYVIVALIVVALIGGGAYFYFHNNNSERWESKGEIVEHSEANMHETNMSDNYLHEDENFFDYNSVLSERKLSDTDLISKSKKELELMRNCIYARHGYRFRRDDLFDFFSQYTWYNPTTSDMTTAYNSMSDIEKYNIDFIKKHE